MDVFEELFKALSGDLRNKDKVQELKEKFNPDTAVTDEEAKAFIELYGEAKRDALAEFFSREVTKPLADQLHKVLTTLLLTPHSLADVVCREMTGILIQAAFQVDDFRNKTLVEANKEKV